MAKLHQNIKKTSLVRKVVGDSTYDQAHFLGTGVVDARNARKDAERAVTDAQNEPVMPIADEEELARARKKMLSRRNRGRASTILGGDAETLG